MDYLQRCHRQRVPRGHSQGQCTPRRSNDGVDDWLKRDQLSKADESGLRRFLLLRASSEAAVSADSADVPVPVLHWEMPVSAH